MIEIKKSKIRLLVACIPLFAYSFMILYGGDPERLVELDPEQVREKHRIFHKIPVEIRSYIGRGLGAVMFTLPLWMIFLARKVPFHIQIKPNFSGRIIYKYSFFKAPIYKNFAPYKGKLSYTAPYIYFNPPLKLTDATSMEKFFLSNSWLLKGGKNTIMDFIDHVNKP